MMLRHLCMDHVAAQHASGPASTCHAPLHWRRRLRRPLPESTHNHVGQHGTTPSRGHSCRHGMLVCAAQRLLAEPGTAQGPSTSQAPPVQQSRKKASQPRGFGKQAKQGPGKGAGKAAEHDSADAPCACGSGLTYRACCQQFHTGAATPTTAPDVARARLSALQLLAGNTSNDISKAADAELQDFMVNSLHPDSPWLMGGAISYKSKRLRRDVGFARDMRWRVVGMTHAEGVEEHTWAVLYVLESRHPDYAGDRHPVLELCSRAPAPAAAATAAASQQAQGKQKRNKKGSKAAASQQQQQQQPQPQGRQEVPLGPWKLLQHTNQLPEHARHLYDFLVQHCPSALGADDSDEEGAESSGEWDAQRPCTQPQGFVQGTPRAGGASSSNSGASSSASRDSSGPWAVAPEQWLVDLLAPGNSSSISAAHGYFVMDDYLAASQEALSDYLVMSAGGAGSAARLRGTNGASAGASAATIAAGKSAPAAVGQGGEADADGSGASEWSTTAGWSSTGGSDMGSVGSSSAWASSGSDDWDINGGSGDASSSSSKQGGSGLGQSGFGRRRQQQRGGEVVIVADVPLYEEEHRDEMPTELLQWLRDPPVDQERFTGVPH